MKQYLKEAEALISESETILNSFTPIKYWPEESVDVVIALKNRLEMLHRHLSYAVNKSLSGTGKNAAIVSTASKLKYPIMYYSPREVEPSVNQFIKKVDRFRTGIILNVKLK